jgi:uncharacterized phiE125 gp8 family phage protein
MQYQVTTPPTNPLFQPADLAYHCRLDSDLAADATEQQYLTDLLAAATEYAQEATASSLLTQTLTASYYTGDTDNREWLTLPRGPVTSVISVTSNGEPVTQFTLTRIGNTDRLQVPNGWQEPLTVIYTAGYGVDPQDCPGDIRHAIRQHVATLYEYRETVTEKSTATVVPHTLDAFYQRKNRGGMVG